MKRSIPFSIAALFCASGFAAAEPVYTTPVGYVSQTIKASQYTLIGLSLHEPKIFQGVISSLDANTVTVDDADFDQILNSGSTYILELDDPSSEANGVIAEIDSWNGDDLTTTPTNLESIGADVGEIIKLRKAATISDVFGSNNSAGLLPGNQNTADVVWISTGGGNFNRYYYAVAQPPFVTAGWKLIGGGDTDRANTPIVYTDGILIQRRGATDLDLVVTGEVKLGDTLISIAGSVYNHIGSVYPISATLGASGLQDFVTQGTSNTADVVWVPDGAGYKRYYYSVAQPPFVTAGWKLIGGGDTDRAGEPIDSGIIIQRRGGAGNWLATPPQ